MKDSVDKKKTSKEERDPLEIVPMGGSTTRASRVLRIGLVAAIVFGISWRLANPNDIAKDADLYATPWAMLALLPVFALGAWAYEVTGRGKVEVKADVVWGVLIALTLYLGLTVGLSLLAA
jgi:hypothetical protein